MRDAAVQNRCPRGEELRHDQAGQNLGVLLCQRSAQCPRRRGRGHRHRTDTHRLARLCERLHDVQPVLGQLERADRFEKRLGHRPLLQGLCAAGHRSVDLQDRAGGPTVAHPATRGFGGPFGQFPHQENIAADLRYLLRLPHRADDVDMIQRVAQPNRISHVLNGGASPTTGMGIDPGVLSGTGHPHAVAISEPRGAMWIATVEHITFAGPCDGFHDESFGQTCDPAVFIDRRAGIGQQPSRLGVMRLDPGVAKDEQSGFVNGLNVLVGQKTQAWFRHNGPLQRATGSDTPSDYDLGFCHSSIGALTPFGLNGSVIFRPAPADW